MWQTADNSPENGLANGLKKRGSMRYFFNVEFSGVGNSPEEAWEDAIEGFELDPGEVPEVTATESEDDDAA
jgi:hypothetical protein